MEGRALIHQWTKDLELLQNRLLLKTDLYGNIISIENISELQNKWKSEFKSFLTKKYTQKGSHQLIENTEQIFYNKQEFEQQFFGYSFLRTLFHGYYNVKELTENSLSLKNFFGQLDLELKLQSKKENNKITNTAVLNKELFKQKDFIQLIRDITHTYNLKVDLNIDLEEIFSFNEQEQIKESSLYLETAVPDLYYIIIAHHTNLVEQEEHKKTLNLELWEI
ncbi:hypothetical protein [Apibacter sp. wkB309]|uniref:hypothetical protein n=1 Tax=Apibacter sp. wkB309 TaxID=1679467 RepID=UPI000CF89C6F|nr:hypothetical protein [Apibacter sp. wkB309]PQL93015.1 hypothetical protein C4S75_01695 [Apibacter sp. wkB309]